jgi:hypothetical protein
VKRAGPSAVPAVVRHGLSLPLRFPLRAVGQPDTVPLEIYLLGPARLVPSGSDSSVLAAWFRFCRLASSFYRSIFSSVLAAWFRFCRLASSFYRSIFSARTRSLVGLSSISNPAGTAASVVQPSARSRERQTVVMLRFCGTVTLEPIWSYRNFCSRSPCCVLNGEDGPVIESLD